MSNLETTITENFPNLESFSILDTLADNSDSELQNQPSVSPWLNWLKYSKTKFNNLTVQLTDESSLIIKSIGDSKHLVIHNKRENTTLLNNFLKEVDISAISDTKGQKSDKKEVVTPVLKPDLKMMDAVRIQKLIIPRFEDIKKEFKNFFVVHEQQDVVGGDFYWYSRKGNQTLLAIVDCTGHSVEGAMTSMICNSLLNQASSDFNGDNVSELLKNFYTQLLKYNKTTSETTDYNYGIGAEVGLFSFNHDKGIVSFCTTGISAVIKRENGIEHLKAKKVISYENIQQSITQTSFPMNDVVGIYGFTDGLADQFDADDKKKLGTRGVLKMIEDEENFDAEYYLSEINKWKGDNIQYDDITLVGIAM
ncbi:MAG: hypothetical protein CMP48_20775 [Rickettsiales bacterium]|nr:hypothetical protein [Rickettsiales bacterium]